VVASQYATWGYKVSFVLPWLTELTDLNEFAWKLESRRFRHINHMVELYFFTKQEVDLDEIRELSKTFCYAIDENGDRMSVLVEGTYMATYLGSGSSPSVRAPTQEYWEWRNVDWTNSDHIALEPSDRPILEEYLPESGLSVTFHWETVRSLCVFLHALMLRFGGWVGLNAEWADEDGNAINFLTADTILDYAAKVEA
jgi:hypothetical protein